VCPRAGEGLGLFTILRVIYPILGWLPLPSIARERVVHEELHQFFVNLITAREHAVACGQPAAFQTSFLDMMIANKGTPAELPMNEMRDQLLMFIHAGFESTAAALSWVLYALSQHADIQTRLRAEVVRCCH
jgi:cytochrome P450